MGFSIVSGGSWTPHKVELAVWTHYVARDIKPEILDGLPSAHQISPTRYRPALSALPGIDKPCEVQTGSL